MFQRILIANRGEIAVRVIRACRELGISPVAVYSDADAGALHVRLADAAVRLGPAAAGQSYLRGDLIVAAAQKLGAAAIHPGYGFLSENAAFARQCGEAGVVFIGPPPAAIEAMGGKIGARRLAQEAGVPVVPGYDGAEQGDGRLLAEGGRIGYPLLIKASAGGGGKGMRVVEGPEAFQSGLEGARREAAAAFGDDTVFLERLILRPRHVEIQVLADSHGTVLHLGERECSIQRRHQKILEESPSPALSPELRQRMGEAAVRVARSAGYVNAGTVEFVLDEGGQFYFLEMNTRLQVEHPVTECVSGLDLVRWQIAIAAGAPLPFQQREVSFRGHAIEVRLYAEDPVTYLPAVGRLALLEPPLGPGVRVDSGLTTGDEVTVHYDPMIAKLIVHAETRPAAIARLARALDDFVALGLTTNLPLLRALVGHHAYQAGETNTEFLAEHQLDAAPPGDVPDEALAAAAIWALAGPGSSGGAASPSDPFASRWRANGGALPVRFQSGAQRYELSARRGGDEWRIAIGGRELGAKVVVAGPNELALAFGGGSERFRLASDGPGGDLLIAWRGSAYRLASPVPLSADDAGRAADHSAANLTAPMPGTLVKVLVREGEAVRSGQPLLVLEAMKMEHTIAAPYGGVVRRLPFAQGASVAGGATLIDLAPDEGS
jgi:3-methylcrotonyl-CoA carboxylase alpha subunit